MTYPIDTGYDNGANTAIDDPVNTGYASGTNTATNAETIAGGAVAPQPNIPTYGYELSQLMKRYGVAAPTPPRTTDQQLLDKYFAPIQSAKMYDNPKGNGLYNAYLDIAQGRMAAPANPMNKFFPGQLVCEAGYRYDPVTATCVKVSTGSPNIGGNQVSTGSPNIGGNQVSTGSPNIGGNQCPPGFNFDPLTRSCVPTTVTNLPALEIPLPKDKPKGPGMTDEQVRSMAGTVTGNAQLFDLYKQDKLSMAQAEKALGSAPVQNWMQTDTFGGDTVNDRNIRALAASSGGPDVLRSLVNSGGADVGDIRRALGDDAVKSWAERYDPALYQKYFGKARGGTFHAPGVPKYAEGDLYRAPPQSMIDFAQQNSSPSLDGLARRYAGAPVAPAPVDPVAAARERYEAASQRLRAAAMAGMQKAPKGPSESEKYFRLASAFLDPGKTGSFGEAAGRAAAAMGDYNREKRAAENDSLAERRTFASQLAELDLGAANTNLETEMTMQARRDAANSPQGAFGKQAMDEGHAFGTPSYYARVKELQELDMEYKERALTSLESSRRSLAESRDNAPTLSDAALDLAVDQYLAGDTTAATGYSRSPAMKVLFTNRLAERATKRGMDGADIAAATAAFQGDKAGFRTLGTRAANADMAVTEALNMMPLALDASAAVDRTQYPTLNAALQAYNIGTGDENIVRLGIAVNSLVNIYSRAVSPTGTPTNSDKDHARELLSAAWNKGQFATAIDQLALEMQAAKASPGQVREDMLNTVRGVSEGSAPASMPTVGDIVQGHKYMGGDPADPANWEKQ
jgi:hypothetical protein